MVLEVLSMLPEARSTNDHIILVVHEEEELLLGKKNSIV